VALGVSVHTLSCVPTDAYGTEAQRRRFLPDLIGGELLGAYCLSEPQSGSDAAALTTRAVPDGDQYLVNGTKAWVTHGGVADYYNVLVRTGGPGPKGISLLLTDAATPGLYPQKPEHKMGLSASPTAQIVFEDAHVPADRLVGAEGQGFTIALQALDGGHHRRGPGPRRLRLRRRPPGRTLDARGQGPPDRRGHQPDPAPGHLPRPHPRLTARSACSGPRD